MRSDRIFAAGAIAVEWIKYSHTWRRRDIPTTSVQIRTGSQTVPLLVVGKVVVFYSNTTSQFYGVVIAFLTQPCVSNHKCQ